MSETKNYTLTVREVLQNLQALADAYEKVASGTSPTGNYYFSCNAADAAASIKAAQQLILQVPVWIPVSERLPPVDEDVLVSSDSGCHVCAYRRGDGLCAGSFEREDMKVIEEVRHWMPLPEEPT